MKIIKKDHVLNGTDNIYNVENFYSVVVKNKRYIKLSFYFWKGNNAFYQCPPNKSITMGRAHKKHARPANILSNVRIKSVNISYPV